MKLEKNLLEYMETAHLKKRVAERVFNISDILLPGEEIDSKLKQKIKDKISLEIKTRISQIRDKNFPEDRIVIYKLFVPIVIYKGKRFNPEITIITPDQSGELKKGIGSLFVMIFVQNRGTTIINYNNELSNEDLIGKQKFSTMRSKDEVAKKLPISVESYPKLYFKINLDEDGSTPSIDYSAHQREESKLGEILASKFKVIMDYNPLPERRVDILKTILTQINDFVEKNKDKLNVGETNSLTSKINSIKIKIKDLEAAPSKAVEKITQKGDYRKGRPYRHKDFGKGLINSVEKISDGVYNISVEFPAPYGLKKLRVKEKEKPDVSSTPGLSESIFRNKIRQLILQSL